LRVGSAKVTNNGAGAGAWCLLDAEAAPVLDFFLGDWSSLAI